jgi:hypothetical protein
MILTLSLLNNFKSRQVDFIQAYTQAPLDCPIYMEVPAGYSNQNGELTFTGEANKNAGRTWVLELKQKMYGLKQTGRNWYQCLHQELLKLSFRQSKVDKCLFYTTTCIIVIYVYDCLLFSPNDLRLNNIIKHLESIFGITKESDIGAYLGLSIQCNAKGHLEITQPGLINRVVHLCGLINESNKHKTPADVILQPPSKQDEPRQLTWNYRQINGILNYIAASSRPDISFAGHQCVDFSSAPRRNHELAIKRIVRYLKGTCTRGYTLSPTKETDMKVYVDADFAGSWTTDATHLASSVKLRTGYVITYANCTLLWTSKMQMEIALTTTKAEYITLSQSLQDLIPLRSMLKEIAVVYNRTLEQAIAYSTVFEDNKGCINLNTAPTMRPQSRHIAIKYHQFREHVRQGHSKIQDQVHHHICLPHHSPNFDTHY